MEHFTINNLKKIFDNNNELITNNYISNNLAVARNPNLSALKSALAGQPMLMRDMRLIIVTDGFAKPIVDMAERYFEAGDIVFVGPASVIQLKEIGASFRGLGISMSNDLFALATGNHQLRAFDGHLRNFKFKLQQGELEYLDKLHGLLYENTISDGASSGVTLHLISAFLCYVDNLWSKKEEAERATQSREQRVFSDFMQLVTKYASQERRINFYASKLFLSPRYMSTLVKKVSGRTAKEWIDDAVITTAKINLRYSQKQVVQISDEMDFPNTSFFSKFFKRLTGMTPLEYKKGEK